MTVSGHSDVVRASPSPPRLRGQRDVPRYCQRDARHNPGIFIVLLVARADIAGTYFLAESGYGGARSPSGNVQAPSRGIDFTTPLEECDRFHGLKHVGKFTLKALAVPLVNPRVIASSSSEPSSYSRMHVNGGRSVDLFRRSESLVNGEEVVVNQRCLRL
jgi:hypothetical protein